MQTVAIPLGDASGRTLLAAKRVALLLLFAIAVIVADGGCGGEPTPKPTSPVASTPPPPAVCSQQPPAWQADPGATADPMLLSWKGGTIVRGYPPSAVASDFDVDGITDGPSYKKDASGPFVFVFELAGPAVIKSFRAALPRKRDGDATVTFAVSLCNLDFKDVGTLTGDDDRSSKSLEANVLARFVRVTATGPAFTSIGATGVLAPLAAGVSVARVYVDVEPRSHDATKYRYKDGAFVSPTDETNGALHHMTLTSLGQALTGMDCMVDRLGPVLIGQIDGRVWTYHGDDTGKMFVSDDGSRLVGSRGGRPFYLERAASVPPYCAHRKSGKGARQVLVLDARSYHLGVKDLYPMDSYFGAQDLSADYSYDRIGAAMLDEAALASKDIAIINMICDPSIYLAKPQTDALLKWVADGHMLLIVDSDKCDGSKYDFLPYPFKTANPGAGGHSGKRLIVVESDALGATEQDDTPHYFDPQKYINAGANQEGDANTVLTSDPHWCGHLFGTNSLNVNGFMQMYLPYEKGVIIYDGLDADDGGNAGYQRLRQLELSLPLPSTLPCSQRVAHGFIIEPDRDSTYAPGTAQTLTFDTELLANQGWKGHVDVTANGGVPARVSPSSFDVKGGTQPLTVTLSVPASASAPTYTVSVMGKSKDGSTSEAVITLTAGQAPQTLQKELQQERVVLYGIHFDFDSAHMQPRSEAVVDQIAKAMGDNPSWRFQVEGHTDSDGGGEYNLGLSQRRAQAVVDDLVRRKRIDASRLVPKGLGLTRPVAPNDTQANKALNRRVELARLH